jgi:hypothetical protein
MPGVEREVRVVDDLRECTCQAYEFSSEQPKSCKHTKRDEAGPLVYLYQQYPMLTPRQVGERLAAIGMSKKSELLRPGAMSKALRELERCARIHVALAEEGEDGHADGLGQVAESADGGARAGESGADPAGDVLAGDEGGRPA